MKTKMKPLRSLLLMVVMALLSMGLASAQDTPKEVNCNVTSLIPPTYYEKHFMYLPIWNNCPGDPLDPYSSNFLASSRIYLNRDNNTFMIPAKVSVGFGGPDPAAILTVNGKITAKDIEVKPSWGDFIFEKNYHLMSLDQVEDFISINKHLPNIPSEAEVTANGIELGKMNSLLLQKIEELTLYIIEMKKENEKLNAKIENLNH